MEENSEARLKKDVRWHFSFPTSLGVGNVFYKNGVMFWEGTDKKVTPEDLKAAGGVLKERWVTEWEEVDG